MHTYRQTDRRTHWYADRHTDIQTDGQRQVRHRKYNNVEKMRQRQTNRDRGGKLDGQTDRDRETEEILMQIERDEETDIPTVKQTDRRTDRGRQMDGWTKRHRKNQVD